MNQLRERYRRFLAMPLNEDALAGDVKRALINSRHHILGNSLWRDRADTITNALHDLDAGGQSRIVHPLRNSSDLLLHNGVGHEVTDLRALQEYRHVYRRQLAGLD